MNPMLFEDIDLSFFNFFFGSKDDKKASKKEKKSEPKKEKKEEKKIVKNNKEEANNNINKPEDKNKKSIKEDDKKEKIINKEETSRLGYYNDNEIKRHPWLSDINFDDLLQGKIRAPFIPRKNYDNYDKKYCQEVEEVGIGTNMRYEHYRNNERYPLLFEGFTYYNVDESKLIPCNDIYRKPNVKYVKSYSSINTSNNYIINKSKTINLDYDYKRRINENMSNNRIPSANNISMRTIHYSNGNEMNSNKVQIFFTLR